MDYIEKEIKLKIGDPSFIIHYLKKHGAKFLNRSREKTTRFDTSKRDLEKRGMFLRVRSGSKNTITLKEKVSGNENVRARKETEFGIEDVKAMEYILQKLGFNSPQIMEKNRINLIYKNTKLSIDELFFGIYLEIEGEEKDIEIISEELGFKPEDKILITYWDILDEYNKKNKTKIKDILFPKGYKSKLPKIY